MDMEVPENVKQRTDRCRSNFACLTAGKRGYQEKCKIDYSGGKNVLILAASDSEDPTIGPYCISFGDRLLCTCPVRYYLYKTGCYKAD